jgi:hypothetical protein
MIPTKHDVELAIQVLELEEKEAIRAFYAKERAIEARKRPWRLAGRIIWFLLMCLGLAGFAYGLVLLWLLGWSFIAELFS